MYFILYIYIYKSLIWNKTEVLCRVSLWSFDLQKYFWNVKQMQNDLFLNLQSTWSTVCEVFAAPLTSMGVNSNDRDVTLKAIMLTISLYVYANEKENSCVFQSLYTISVVCA